MLLHKQDRLRQLSIRGVSAVLMQGLAVASIVLSTSASLANEDNAFANAAPKLAHVTVAPVTRQEVVGRVPISGTLVPLNEALIYPEVNGSTIDTLLVDVGDIVTRGMELARLNARTLTAQVAQANAEFARAEAGVSQAQSQIVAAQAGATQANSALDRTRRLKDAGTTTQSVLDQAIANGQTADANLASAQDGLIVAQAILQQAKAALDIAQLNLDRAVITAPADGIISARNGQIGAIATSGGEPIFRLIVDGAIEVEAEVIETALGDIEVGDTVDLEIASIGPVTGTVRRLSPTVNPTNRLGSVRITANTDKPLRTGLFASGWVITARRQALVVPATAVLTDANGDFVLVVLDGVLNRKDIVGGLIWQGNREIISDLTEGAFVVAKAGAFFADGDKINPIFPGATRAEGASE